MTSHEADRARLLRRLAVVGAVFTGGLIVLGGIVRITGSGMGCGDHWPRCNGEWFPPLDLPTLIEISHRWAAALVGALVAAVAAVALWRHRADRELLGPGLLALLLLVTQVLLGAVTVKLELPPWVVIVHLANAMLLLAALVVTAMRGQGGSAARRLGGSAARHAAHPLVQAAVGLGFIVILFGAKVANFNAGLVCRGFPLCADAGLLPPDVPLGTTHWLHRVLAFAFLACAVALFAQLRRRTDPPAAALRRTAGWVVGLTLIQIAVAAAMVLTLLPPSLRALHLLVGTAVWVALVALAVHSSRTPALAAAPALAPAAEPPSRRAAEPPSRRAAEPSIARDLVTLTKPRIISLLLLTTIAPMFITDRGMPGLDLVLWVAIGGYLMAGGANAINMWFDRDIDQIMTRTRTRPIAAGRISAAAGLTFGIALGATAFAIFWFLVNPLSAWLALAGLLFYVFIYTVWLKRSSPQNIVIGGAAGAFPPLVGWAAVTGGLDLAALYLFAIIFYWTPPHFWALALIKRREYARAGVPMLPVVRSEKRTKVEMLIYSLLLLPLTIMPSVFGALGPFYGVAAALLGGRLVWDAVRVLREQQTGPAAWRMYKYSLLYLALLFVAMGVDRALPFERGPRASDVIILSHPGAAAAPHVETHPGH